MFARDEFLLKLSACEEELARWEGLAEARFTVETLQAKMETIAGRFKARGGHFH